MVQKKYSNIHPASCTNTDHDVTDLVHHGVDKNTKTWISWEWNIITFLRNKKKILNLSFRWQILRSYHFVADVTFKPPQNCCIMNINSDLPTHHIHPAWKTILTIWKNIKAGELEKFPFPNCSVNWEKFGCSLH